MQLYLLRYEREEIVGIFSSEEVAAKVAKGLFDLIPKEYKTPVFLRPREWKDDFRIQPFELDLMANLPEILVED